MPEKADEILITLKDGRQLEAKKLGSDADSDIALLQVDADNLTEIKIADSECAYTVPWRPHYPSNQIEYF